MKNVQLLSFVTIYWDYLVRKEFASALIAHIGKMKKKNHNAVLLLSLLTKIIFYTIIRFSYILIHLVQAHVFSQKCASSEECDGTKNLICKEGVCECKENTLFWNEKSTSCGNLFKVFNTKN